MSKINNNTESSKQKQISQDMANKVMSMWRMILKNPHSVKMLVFTAFTETDSIA